METILKRKSLFVLGLIILSVITFLLFHILISKMEISTNVTFSVTSLNSVNDIINQISQENGKNNSKKSSSNNNKQSLKDKIEQAKNKLSKKDYKACKSQYKQMNEHIDKLEKYKSNPLKYDNQGHLANAPNDAVRQRIINGRINHLETEIKTLYDNIVKILNTVQ